MMKGRCHVKILYQKVATMPLFRLLGIVAASCCFACFSSVLPAQAPISDVSNRVDELAAEYIGDGKPIVGGVIGIVDGSKCYAKGYGQISLDEPVPTVPDVDTIYEIASVSKTFTGTLLGELAARGELAVTDPLEKFMPSGIAVPQYEGQKILLRQLSTHSSGLPRLPTDFWDVAAPTPNNPYKNYTREHFERFLDSYQLTVAPDTRYEYSNLAASILGYAMERKTGRTYEQLVQERIGQPLGMEHTAVELTDVMRERLAPPYNGEKKPDSNWDLPGFAGGGGLRSSVRDMLRFAQAAAGVFEVFPELAEKPDHPLIVGMKTASETHYDVPEQQRMGLGWHLTASGDLFHNGQTGGYHSFIIVDPKSHRAIVILTNTAVGAPDQLGHALWNDFDSLPEDNDMKVED